MPRTPQKITIIQLINNDEVSYHHCLFVQDLSKSCDSATVLAVINRYLQDNHSDLPVSGVSVFHSLEHYDSGESLSQSKDFYGDCVVEVWFDASSGRPRSFYFYDSRGNIEFEGTRWKP
jgi:hypothetical protein